MSFTIPILLYHHITDEITAPTVVRPHQFAAHLDWLGGNNYNVISLAYAAKLFHAGACLPENPIVLTFDDGYEDNYLQAYPLLKQYGVVSTIFVTTCAVGKWNYWNCRAKYKAVSLSPAQIQEMSDYGVEFGSHGHSHHSLLKLSDAEIRDEMSISRDFLQGLTRKEVTTYAYPYGHYDNRTCDLISHEFSCAAADSLGVDDWALNPFAVKRLSIWYKHSLEEFAQICSSNDSLVASND